MSFHYPHKPAKAPARPKSQPVRVTPAPKPSAPRSLANLIERASKDRDGKVKGR